MDDLLKAAGWVLYIALCPLFAVVELFVEAFGFLSDMRSVITKIRFRALNKRLWRSLSAHRLIVANLLNKSHRLQ